MMQAPRFDANNDVDDVDDESNFKLENNFFENKQVSVFQLLQFGLWEELINIDAATFVQINKCRFE